jgi:YbbR domain-containing protein
MISKDEALKIRMATTKHFFKIFSLFAAISLWFYVLNSEPMEITKEIPFEFLTPPGQAISNLVPPGLTVKFKGSRAFMQNLYRAEERIYLDLRDPQYAGRQEFEVLVSPSMIPVPFGVEVLEVSPSLINVELDREITKEVPVRLQLQGELSNDLRMVLQDLEPNRVMITGPVEVMRRTTALRTTPLNVGTLDGEGELRLRLFELDQRIRVQHEGDFLFRYSIKAQTANLTLKNVRVRFLASRQDFSARQREVAIDVLAPEGRTLRESEVQVIADIPEEARGNVNVRLRAVLPEGVHLLQIHPETISVRVR